MRNTISTLFVFISVFCYSQENINTEIKNELKLNIPYLLAGAPEITYERILSEDTALGISAAIYLEEESSYNFHVMPYYRLYFGKKIASGFFVEGNGALISRDALYFDYDEESDFYDTNIERDQIALGLGLALGVKFMIKQDWLIEIYGGLGRNFLNNDLLNAIYGKGGISLGKRF